MAILDLKSNLSQWRKPTTVESGEKKKLSESPVKAVYSTSNELKPPTDIKINKVDNSTSIQVPGAKKIDYKLFSINAKRNRGIPAISTLFGDTILNKVSQYKEQRVKEINKVSEFIKFTPRGIQHISTIEILKTILKEKLSLYKDQLPINILKLSLYKDQLPINILKLSLYKDQLPAIIDKLSLYKDQIPNILGKLSLYKDQSPRALPKISEYIQKLIDNKNSIYDTRKEILGFRNVSNRLRLLYRGKYPPSFNYFNDLTSGAKGFIINQKELETAFLGISGNTYTYPITVREGRLSDSTKIKGAQQWPLKVTFSNRLGNTKYTRTVYNNTKPYTSNTGITGDTLEKYFFRTNSDSARDILYSAFNLRDNSFNTGNFAIFDSPLILTGIQRKDFVKTGFYPWETWKFDDGFIRGGVVTSTQRAIVDVLRLGKWFASVKGLLFIARQAGLQASAPNTEADPLVGKRAGNGALTLISSLANTATQHLGLRFRKDAVPIVPRSTYSSVMFGASTDNGRGVTTVKQSKILNRLALLTRRLIDLKRPTIDIISTGLGGPQSLYGIGVTNIRRAVNSTGPFTYNSFKRGPEFTTKDPKTITENIYNSVYIYNDIPLEIEDIKKYYKELSLKLEGSAIAGTGAVAKSIPNGIFNFNNSGTSKTAIKNKSTGGGDTQQYYTLGYDDIRILASSIGLNTTSIQNFLLLSPDNNAKWISTKGSTPYGGPPSDYIVTSQHRRSKVKYPDYGIRGKDLRNPSAVFGVYGKDRFSMVDPIWKVNQTEVSMGTVDDFIKLMFEDLQTREKFRFRAYIENVSEDFSPNWQEVKILGRADSPYIYQGFERNLSVSFKAAALSRGDLMLMWDQLERLARTTVPSYKSGYKMVGPLIKFTLGNWFIATPAYIKSLSYTVDNETPWEINLGNTGINSQDINAVGEMPMYVTIQANLQIFGEIRPEDTTEDSQLPNTVRYNTGNLYPLGQTGLRNMRQKRFTVDTRLAGGPDYNQLNNQTTLTA